jgi:O-acetylhomoserine (thiol)-lyase
MIGLNFSTLWVVEPPVRKGHSVQTIGFDTTAVHGRQPDASGHRAIRFPVHAGVAFHFDSAEDLEAAFSFRKPAHAYSRVTNPTVEAFEQKITALEEGRGAMGLSSGMAAITNVVFNLVQHGDNIVAANALFGNTYSLFKETLRRMGIQVRFVDISDAEQVRQAMDDHTRVVFLETISNPLMQVPDIACIAQIAHAKGAVVVVDGSVTTPCLIKGNALGVDVMVHSSTKLISGGATSVGGVIIDTGFCDWSDVPNLGRFGRFGEWAFLVRLRREVYRNLGACMAPQTAYLQSLGLETLSLRMERACDSCRQLAQYLAGHPRVRRVHYPGLADSPFHALAMEQFKGRYGSILSFELADKSAAFEFLNRLRIIRRATNLGDNASLAIHPASTIFNEYAPEEKAAMGVTAGLVRLSVGIETLDDLIGDLDQALKGE